MEKYILVQLLDYLIDEYQPTSNVFVADGNKCRFGRSSRLLFYAIAGICAIHIVTGGKTTVSSNSNYYECKSSKSNLICIPYEIEHIDNSHSGNIALRS